MVELTEMDVEVVNGGQSLLEMALTLKEAVETGFAIGYAVGHWLGSN